MLVFFVIAPVLIAVFLFLLATNSVARVAAIVLQSILFAASVYLVIVTRDAEIITFIGAYDDILGILLRADRLAADFVMLTTLIFLVVSVYTYRTHREKRVGWFLMFVLEASFIGLFLTSDIFNVFVLLEVSTLVTLILVMFDREKRALFAGKVFLLTNIVVIQFFLLGLGYIYRLTGALDMVRVAEWLRLADPADLRLPYVLVMTAIAFKCTLVPFFSWTPKTRIYPSAPTAVAAILSGLQIKSAVYLFIRFQDIFQPVALQDFFLFVGIFTGLFGAIMAISQTNIRMILAYHTISQVGLIIIGVSMNFEHAYIGGLYHIFSHGIFKTTLFLSTGIIVHSYGTSNIYKIRGVARRMPLAAAATAAAVLGITGAPFFVGSISKYFITYDVPLGIDIAVILVSLGTIISFIKFSAIFFGKSNLQGDIPRAELCRTVPIAVMGVLCLAGGIFGTRAIYFLFRYQVSVILSSYIQKSIVFMVSIAVGWLIYKYLVVGNGVLKRLGELNFGFRSICASMGVFFAVMLVMLY